MRDQRKTRAAAARAAAPQEASAARAASRRPPHVLLTPAAVIPPWMRGHAGSLRLLEARELLEAVAPAVAAELARSWPIVDAAVAAFVAARPADDPIAFRYEALLASAAAAMARATNRVRAGQRFVRAGQGLIVQVRVDRAAADALYELHEAVRALWGQYQAWLRSQPPPAPACLQAAGGVITEAFRQRIARRVAVLRAAEQPARFRLVEDA